MVTICQTFAKDSFSFSRLGFLSTSWITFLLEPKAVENSPRYMKLSLTLDSIVTGTLGVSSMPTRMRTTSIQTVKRRPKVTKLMRVPNPRKRLTRSLPMEKAT